MPTNLVRTLRFLPLAAGVLGMSVMSGCLVSGSSSDVTSGAYVGKETFGQIEPGKTRNDWVQATLGKPCSKSSLEDGTEMWKWTYQRKRSSSGGVFLLVGGSSKSETIANTFVQFEGDTVVKAWQD